MASTLSDDELLSINPQFAGLFWRLSLKKDDVPSAAEVVDDYEDDKGDEASAGLSGLEDVLKNASK